MPDRIDALREAAAARHAATLSRAETALAVLAQGHETVTFRRLAEAARVSRSWVYRQPELRAAVEGLRGSALSRERSLVLQKQATLDSLRQQIHAYRAEIARVQAENQVGATGPTSPQARRRAGSVSDDPFMTLVGDMS